MTRPKFLAAKNQTSNHHSHLAPEPTAILDAIKNQIPVRRSADAVGRLNDHAPFLTEQDVGFECITVLLVEHARMETRDHVGVAWIASKCPSFAWVVPNAACQQVRHAAITPPVPSSVYD